MSTSTLRPVELIDNVTVPLDIETVKAFLVGQRLLQSGDFKLLTPATINVAPSANTTFYTLVPPSGTDDEWLVYGIAVNDTANIDGADNMIFSYADEITNAAFELQRALLNSFISNNFKYPTKIPATVIGTQDILPIPLIVTRKTTNEAWKTIRMQAITTATAGTRTFQPRTLYIPRRRLNW
jgi:hypothetical protein